MGVWASDILVAVCGCRDTVTAIRSTGRDPTVEVPANARLIVAAPDLLEACKIVLASMRVDNGNQADIHLLETAIARAEGGAA